MIGDNLEAHELWQNANLQAQGLSTGRLSTPASQNNPVIMLDRATHQQVSAAQYAFDASAQTPVANINANAAIMRAQGVVPEAQISLLQELALLHAQSYGFQ